MEVKTRGMVEFTQAAGGNYRWITVTTLLLAIGVILRVVTPSVGGITPNWMIAMYCLATLLTRPTLSRAAAIGLVAGALIIPFSKSALPYCNLLSEPLGAVVCALITRSTLSMKVGGYTLRPAVATFFSTLVSGFTFITITKLVLSLPLPVYLYVMMPVVFTVAAVNTVLAQLIYFPAQKLFSNRGQ